MSADAAATGTDTVEVLFSGLGSEASLSTTAVLQNNCAYFQKIINLKIVKSLAAQAFFLFVQFYLYGLIIS